MHSSLKNTLSLWATDTSSLLGNLHAIQRMGFDRLICRIAVHHPVPEAVPYQIGNLAQIIADAGTIGMEVDAWVYGYPDGINQQVGVISQILNGYTTIRNIVLDFEGEWEGKDGALADQFLHGIAEATNHRVALHLSSFDNPQSHPLPYKALLGHCASFMPQSYRIPPTTVQTVMGRTLGQCVSLAEGSLGGALIPTVNKPEMLAAIAAAGPSNFTAASVWLWDGSGTDIGVHGHEDEWKEAISAYKAAFK